MFWILAIIITVIACAALYYAAAGRVVNASGDAAALAHYRLQLSELEGDTAAGRLGPAEATAAKAELAREVIRLKSESAAAKAPRLAPQGVLALAVLATAVLAIGTYSFLGHPELPAQPLAERPAQQPEINIEDALLKIEAQLEKTPDDIRGWTVIAPVYMQMSRYAEAEHAFRRIIELGGPTADAETDLAEALMMKQQGSLAGEPLALLNSAAARDPRHIRSRFYLASEATRAGAYEDAVKRWNDLLALGQGDEPWVVTAKQGLAVATEGLNGGPTTPDTAAIAGMVEGLGARLESQGGSIEEWTQLVRSRLVLGQTDKAQADYDAARQAYPDAKMRTELDVLAADNGLVAR